MSAEEGKWIYSSCQEEWGPDRPEEGYYSGWSYDTLEEVRAAALARMRAHRLPEMWIGRKRRPVLCFDVFNAQSIFEEITDRSEEEFTEDSTWPANEVPYADRVELEKRLAQTLAEFVAEHEYLKPHWWLIGDIERVML